MRHKWPHLRALAPQPHALRRAWPSLVASLHSANGGKWKKLRVLRAVRPNKRHLLPLHRAPHLSGASLCYLGNMRLALFGGRDSATGETLGRTLTVSVSWFPTALAQWDELVCTPSPPPRCYHSAVRWPAEMPSSSTQRMLIFGGAGEGLASAGDQESLGLCGDNRLFGDTWLLTLEGGGGGAASTWERVAAARCADDAPPPRSSHVCAIWGATGAAILHGGLGNDGTMADVWMLGELDQGWQRCETDGAHVARAHHCGGITRDELLIFSGQDEGLLTIDTICILELRTFRWSVCTMPGGPHARIDASAAAIDGLGLVVFGGVGSEFEFVKSTPWLIAPTGQNTVTPWSAVSPWEKGGPRPRACASVAYGDNLHVYVFGGFDGITDMDDLWCLSLRPGAFVDGAAEQGQRASGAGRGVGDFDDEVMASEFKARRAAQVAELAGLRGASGESYMPIHVRVWRAGQEVAATRT